MIVIDPGETVVVEAGEVKYPQRIKITCDEDGTLRYLGEPLET